MTSGPRVPSGDHQDLPEPEPAGRRTTLARTMPKHRLQPARQRGASHQLVRVRRRLDGPGLRRAVQLQLPRRWALEILQDDGASRDEFCSLCGPSTAGTIVRRRRTTAAGASASDRRTWPTIDLVSPHQKYADAVAAAVAELAKVREAPKRQMGHEPTRATQLMTTSTSHDDVELGEKSLLG